MQMNDSPVTVVAGFQLQQKLGSGSFAKVYKGVHQQTGRVLAIKIIDRDSNKLTKKVIQNLELEISILRNYRHRNIVCLEFTEKDSAHIYMGLEFCAGGDVQHLIRSRKSNRISEVLTRRLMRDLSGGLRFLWNQQLIHRDIKPQNLLLSGPLPLDETNDPEKTAEDEKARQDANFPTKDFCLKIADFGFARHLQTTSLAETLCGSPLYMAPEILQHHRYDAKADLWSVGTVLFEMITGSPPFHGENHIDLLRNIQRKAVRLPKDVKVSKECVNLLRILLARNPMSRAGFQEFFGACDKFVQLGCNGVAVSDEGFCKRPSMEPIPEDKSPSQEEQEIHEVPPQAPPAPAPSTQPLSPAIQQPKPQVTAPPFSQVPTSLLPVPDKKPITNYLSPLVQSPSTSGAMTELQTFNKKPDLEKSAGENSFVMVELGSSQTKSPPESSVAIVSQYGDAYDTQNRLEPSPPSSPSFYVKPPLFKPNMMARGILSTSPGTGGALMGLFTGRQLPDNIKVESQLKSLSKILAASEDVGRRAISVAHLGDRKAFSAMKMGVMTEGSTASILSVTPMEGIEEDSGEVTDDSGEICRRRSSTSSAVMSDVKGDLDDEMPFAVKSESKPIVAAGMPSRSTNSFTKETTITGPRPVTRPTPAMIRTSFAEALCCYLKSLHMLKGAMSAAQKVGNDIENLQLPQEQQAQAAALRKRSEPTAEWLGNQFRGVLERAEAANAELTKFPSSTEQASVEELLYEAALAYGREGAVKQLLGHYEAARDCFRSAGLLAETLLMEPKISGTDRQTIEGYVDGFSSQIADLDAVLQQKSIMSRSSSMSGSRRQMALQPLVEAPK